jgi:hypothetical protein
MSEIVLESVLVCPVCGFAKRETMLTEACQFFCECAGCKTSLRPKPGDCCVFCSYDSVKCPPMQSQSCPGSQDGEISRTEGKTPAFAQGEVQKLLDAVETSTDTGLRDRALLGVLAYTFARIVRRGEP